MPAAAPEQPRRVIRITARTAVLAVLAVVLTILGLRLFVSAHQPLSWAVAAAVVAVLIDPIVDVLDRRLPRILSVIIALLVLAAVTWAVIYVAFDDLSSGVERLGESAQDAADELEARDDSIGRAARDVDASRRVDLFVDALDERVTGGDDVLASTAGTAPTYFVGGILTLFLMSYGPTLARSAVDQLPDPRVRGEVSDIVTRAVQRSRRAVLLTVAEGIVVGLAVAAAAALLDVPSPAALGLAAGVMAMLPHVGIVLGTLPLVLLVLALNSDVATIATVVVVLACQVGDSFWLRRRISARSVHIGLLVPWVVALVGYEVYGVGGAAYGLALAVFGLAVLDELGGRTQSTAPIDESPEGAGADDVPLDEGAPAGAAVRPDRPSPDEAGVPG
ncbi:MAG TPA: AI-2E family transporter [Acidimicrobiales bacterium]|nr:AI-2E family transporter [Acidimicrobiales bacterium]